MIFTLNWLYKYFSTTVQAVEIYTTLDNIGFEVESVKDGSELYKNFIVAEILSTSPHPNSDKLQLCEVDFGANAPTKLICGAKNARAGIKVVLAKIGAIIPSNGMEIKQSKIRDVVSNGMLCSETELNLGDDSDGIIELPEDAKVGESFAKYKGLDEVVVDVAITPNRGDAASVYGIARDLQAAGLGTLKEIEVDEFDISQNSKSRAEDIFEISDKENVTDFTLVKISDLKNVGESEGISNLISAIGNSNNGPLVDISNYGMYSLGRPNHMYDADKIDGKINIKLSDGGEEFLALNGETYTLPKGLTIIVDQSKVLAIAGVIGGEESKVNENTKNILFEVGNFSKASVVKAGRALNINTDSRYRFERMVDPSNTQLFVKYMLKVILDNCGGVVESFQRFYAPVDLEDLKIEYNASDFKKLVGSEIAQSEVDHCLEKLGFKKVQGSYIVPKYRIYDVEGKADLTEEVLRIGGTSFINAEKFGFTSNIFGDRRQKKIDKLRYLLSSKGYVEQITWSFYGSNSAKLAAENQLCNNAIKIANPISQEMSVMRQSIFPNLFEILENNLNRGIANISFFEIGKVFRNGKEINVLSGIRCGNSTDIKLHGDSRALDYFDIKSDVEASLDVLGFDYEKLNIQRTASEFFHPQISAECSIGKNKVIQIGKAHPSVLKKYGLDKKNIYMFELNLDDIPIKLKDKFGKLDISDLQHVKRDLAFVVPADFDSLNLVNFIKSQNKKIFQSVRVFDDYKGDDQIRSLGVRIEMKPKDKTFTEQEIEKIVENVINKVREKFNFELK